MNIWETCSLALHCIHRSLIVSWYKPEQGYLFSHHIVQYAVIMQKLYFLLFQ